MKMKKKKTMKKMKKIIINPNLKKEEKIDTLQNKIFQ
jgi:hypothetical protein